MSATGARFTSSKTFITNLEFLTDDIDELLADQKTFPVPPKPDPSVTPLTRLRRLETLKSNLELEYADAYRLVYGLRKALTGIFASRQNMNSEERQDDDSTYEVYEDNKDNYHDVEKRIAKYTKELSTQKIFLEEAIALLQDEITPSVPPRGAAATALPLSVTQSQAYLAPITLPNFDGTLSEWNSFWDQFKALVHKDGTMPDVIKMRRLKECLTGRAAQAINGQAIDDAGYAESLKILKDEFGRTSDIKQALYHQLLTVPSTSGSDANLRTFLDAIETILLRLQQMGEAIDTFHISSTIMKKLPPSLLTPIYAAQSECERNGDNWTTQKLKRKLKDILYHKEKVSHTLDQARVEGQQLEFPLRHSVHLQNNSEIRENASSQIHPQSPYKPEKYETDSRDIDDSDFEPPPISMLLNFTPVNSMIETSKNKGLELATDTSVSDPPNQLETLCLFCNANHFSSNCHLGLSARYKCLRNSGRCFKCLQCTHRSKECKEKCSLCFKDHHKLLCQRNLNLPHSVQKRHQCGLNGSQSAACIPSANFKQRHRSQVLLRPTTAITFNPQSTEVSSRPA